MFHRLATVTLGLVLGCTALVTAATPAPMPPKPQGAEVDFVTSIQQDLNARFPTAQDAEKAGYFRYTNEDDTGAISYANTQWQSADPRHPSQLWYDVNGKLLGADFSVLKSTSPNPPSLWGVDPRRWDTFHAHVHYVLVDDTGKETYGAAGAKAYTAAGGDINHPSAAILVKIGKAKSESTVKHVFLSPLMWDLIVWVRPNPNGAFAEKNPDVKVSKSAMQGEM